MNKKFTKWILCIFCFMCFIVCAFCEVSQITRYVLLGLQVLCLVAMITINRRVKE